MSKTNFVFFGTPQLSVWVLEELKNKNILPSLIVTTPDTPSGRKLVPYPTPTKVWALDNNIPVFETNTLKDERSFAFLSSQECDFFVVAAYNFIIPKKILDIPKKKVLNVHPSMLPKMRGPSPIRSAILTDDRDAVGVSIMLLDEKIDNGPVLAQKKVETEVWPVLGRVLDEKLFREGGKLLAGTIPLWIEDKINPTKQDDSKATFSKKFTKSDGIINLENDAYQNYLKFCAFDIWPRVYFMKNGKRIIITDAVLSEGKFIIKKIIPEGGKEQEYRG